MVVVVAVAAVLAAVADVAVVDANVSVLAALVHEMCATSAPTPHAPRNVRHQRSPPRNVRSQAFWLLLLLLLL